MPTAMYNGERGTITQHSLIGSVLVAHPVVQNIALRKSVILVGEHLNGQISGVQLNHPCFQFLGDIDSKYRSEQLGNVPIYNGGPHEKNICTLVAWVITARHLELYYSISAEEAAYLQESYHNVQLRGFWGYTIIPNIDQELSDGLWIVYSASDLLGIDSKSDQLWSTLVKLKCPDAIV